MNRNDALENPVVMTLSEVREFLDGNEAPDLEEAMDAAQGDVHCGAVTVSYVLIKITVDD